MIQVPLYGRPYEKSQAPYDLPKVLPDARNDAPQLCLTKLGATKKYIYSRASRTHVQPKFFFW